MCKRSFATQNPIITDRTMSPTLRRRSGRSLLCRTCPKVSGPANCIPALPHARRFVPSSGKCDLLA
eukprot:12603641-Alexandrium_andersonii.AAC.1